MKSLNIQYNPRIDQLRWLAATIVFLFHFYLEFHGLAGIDLPGPWTALITEGHTGSAQRGNIIKVADTARRLKGHLWIAGAHFFIQRDVGPRQSAIARDIGAQDVLQAGHFDHAGTSAENARLLAALGRFFNPRSSPGRVRPNQKPT